MAIFLRENGVLSMGNKTPVTILHETLNRKGETANYELIYNGVGTLDPIFKYQVSASGFTAIGDGKTKKEAKHDAAAALLRKMQINNPKAEDVKVKSAENVDIASPYSGSLKENFIGLLEDICVVNKIPFAVFKSISELGPPHARIFTMECKLSSCTEVAVARTKKQAKHMAAQQMINRVIEILGDKYIPVVVKIVDYDNPEEPSNLRDIENGTFHHDISVPLANLHNVFHLKREELRTPEELFDLSKEPLSRFDDLENPKEYLESLVRKLEGICKTTVVSNTALRGASPTEKNSTFKSYVKSDNDSEKTSFEVDGNGEDSIRPIENPVAKKFGSGEVRIMIYLTVVCPQGEYVFSAIASDLDTAERQAAIEALQFLRIMSLPSGSAETHLAADPLDCL